MLPASECKVPSSDGQCLGECTCYLHLSAKFPAVMDSVHIEGFHTWVRLGLETWTTLGFFPCVKPSLVTSIPTLDQE